MGATGFGAVPTMIFEFDNWDNGAADQNSDNHVGFHWSPVGAGLTNDVVVPIDEVRLNNQEPHPATPNRFRMLVTVEDGEVACELEAIDQGVDLGEVYRFEIPDFVPFEGFVGVTGSTGGANQNHIIHSVRIAPLVDPGPAQKPFRRGDPDDSGGSNITDAVAVLNYLFVTGDPLPDPFPALGADRTQDALLCE